MQTEMRKFVSLLGLVLICTTWQMQKQQQVLASIDCNTLSSDFEPCTAYVIGASSEPSSSCCSAVQSIYQQISGSRDDRVAACNCLKSVPASAIDASHLASLPSDCGVSFGFTLSTSLDCNSIP